MVGGAGCGGGVVVGGDGEVGIEVRVGHGGAGSDELRGDDDMVEDLGVAVFEVGPALIGRKKQREVGEGRSDESGDSGLNDLGGGQDVGVGVGGEGVGVAVGELECVEVATGDDVLAGGLEGLDVFGDVLGLELFFLARGGGGGAVDAGEGLHVVDDDGDGVVVGVAALDADVEDEPWAVVEGDGIGGAGGGEGLRSGRTG